MGKGKNLKAILLWILSYMAFLFILIMLLREPIKSNFNENKYMDALNEYKRILLEGERIALDVAFYAIDGIKTAEVESKIGFTDKEHLRIEALLNGIDEENLSKGLVSYIKDGTRLIGLSIKNGIAYVVLSDEFLESKDIGKAKHQIKETLRMENPDLRVAIIVDDEII